MTSKIQITDEMVERASKAYGDTDHKHWMRAALEAAFNPPLESDIQVSEDMSEAGAEFLEVYDPEYSDDKKYAADIFRAMESVRRKEGGGIEAAQPWAGQERRRRFERRQWTTSDFVCHQEGCGKTFPCPKRRKDDPK